MDQLLHRWRTFALCLVCLLINSVQPAHAGVTEWMDIRLVDGFLLVETEVAGIPGQSIIDTGAQATSVNSRFLESENLAFKKGRKVTVTGVFGKSKRSTYRKIPGRIFGAPVTFTNVIELEFDSPDIQFLLGANFFESYVFQFDYPNERMRLITRDAVDLAEIENVDARKDRDGGSLLVKVDLDEDDVAWLLMDTGTNGGILVDRSVARRMDWIDTYVKESGVASGAISRGEMEYFKLPSLKVGLFEIENVLVSIPAEGESPRFFDTITPVGTKMPRRNAADGLLGYDILQHFVVTIDYDRGHVHFYPGEKTAAE